MTRYALVVSCALLAACAQEQRAVPSATGSLSSAATHHLLTLELVGREVKVLSARTVDGPVRRPRVETPGEWRLEARGSDGAVLSALELPRAGVVRGELPDDAGALQLTIHEARAVFNVQLDQPAWPARLVLFERRPDGTLVELGATTAWVAPQ